jgi:high affinity Mn2+ porin
MNKAGLFTVCLILIGLSRGNADDLPVGSNSCWLWNCHFQATVIPQGHPAFSAAYSGQNSLSTNSELDTSLTATLFMGTRLFPGLELYLDPEVSAGTGFSHTMGIAGFPNGEIYRVGDPYPSWNIGRCYLQYTLGLGGEQETVDDGQNQLAGKRDVSRLTLVAGKFSLSDFFDDNAFSHDPRNQFLNWALMDNGAWDYAADTRGYTWGIMAEFNQQWWAVRLATAMEPTNANGDVMDLNVLQAHGDNLEVEGRWMLWQQTGKVRLQAYWNHADMGNYETTLNTPGDDMDITKSRQYCSKYGFGLDLEQAIAGGTGIFCRIGWDDGATESWAFAEIDRTASFGINLDGGLWGRLKDHAGVAICVNGLSQAHLDYLKAGGYGFMIGDGNLNYAPEGILEIYYFFSIQEGLSISPDYQFIVNPAYNQDRGPVSVFSARLHYEF